MKKVLGFVLLLALFATSAFAANSPQRSQGLGWGNWEPEGFEAVADTTFLNGAGVNTAALSNVDTTNAFNTTGMDWGMSTSDPNVANPVLKLWVSGDFVSTDSVFVTAQYSFDKFHWISSGSATTAGNVVQGNQVAFSVPFTFIATPGVLAAPSSNALVAAPFIRFLVAADGNTAARMAATRAWVVYGDVRENPNPQPQLVVQRLKFGTHTPQGFVAEKDSSSIVFSAPDTLEAINTIGWSFGPSGQAPAVADSSTAFGSLLLTYTDPSTNDSVYVQQQVSPDGVKFSSPRLYPDQFNGSMSGIPIGTLTGLDGSAPSFALLNVGMFQSIGARVNGLGFTPFVRYTIRAGNSGQVMGGTKAWISYWRIPRK